MDFGYLMFMAESENAFPAERKQAVDDCISDFCEMKDQGINPNLYIHQVLSSHNLQEYNLTKTEIQRINRTVSEW